MTSAGETPAAEAIWGTVTAAYPGSANSFIAAIRIAAADVKSAGSELMFTLLNRCSVRSKAPRTPLAGPLVAG